MAFFRTHRLPATRLLTTAALGLAGSLALTSTAQAGLLSTSGNTYLVRDGQQFYYSSDVNGERFTGTIRGNYNPTGIYTGRFTDYSTQGEGCSGSFVEGKIEPDGTRELYFDVDRAAPNHRCQTIGQSFEIQVESMGRNAYSSMLWASAPNEQIPLYESVMALTPMESYGIRGDRVTLIKRTPYRNRLRVTFSSGVTAWVETSNVIYD